MAHFVGYHEDYAQQIVRQRRPQIMHAATASIVPSRQELNREHAFREPIQAQVPQPEARPWMFRRMTDKVSRVITGAQTPSEHELSPYQPSYWTDHAHETRLLQIWDAMSGVAYPNDPDGRRARQAKIDATLRRVSRAFGELLHGSVQISREWIEHVLRRNGRFDPPRQHYLHELGVAGSTGRAWGPWY